MKGRNAGLTSRSRHTWITVATAVAVALVAAACSSTSSSTTSSSTAANAAGGSSTTSNTCGTSVPVGPANPSGVYASMSPALKAIYSSFPGDLIQSPWATTKIKAKPPWKIGFIAFAITSPYNDHVLIGLQQQFAIAKKEGLVQGSLLTNIPATMAASTAEEQISAIEQMVSEGVNAIILLPVDSVAEASAIDAAGKAGVPVILADTPPAPNTPYAVSAWSQNQVQADAGALGLIQKGNIIMVKGVPGNENDVVLYDQAIADLKDCPNIHVASTLYGQWDEGTAKTVVAEYLAAHPGSLAGAIQDGGMMSGIIEAFQAQGLNVPVIADGECYAGDLSWWLAHKSSYKTVAQCFNGYQGSYVYWDVTMRILDNKGPKYNVLEMPSPAITVSNLAEFAQPGVALTSDQEVGGPTTAWCDNTCLDKYFNTPGAVTAP
jgi:ribose transport system substrate-binding protein